MRTHALAIAAACAIFVLPVSASAQSIRVGPGGVQVEGPGGDCQELRRACENKGRLGERGEGNCRRYREQCGERRSRVDCAELRSACLNKERLGEQGEGNCRRYRELCRR